MMKTTKVLLVCDSEDLTQEIVAAFRESDCKIDYHCLESFSSINRNVEADIVVLDMGFHVEKGLSLLKNVKSRFPNMPVILLAEDSSEDHVITAFRLGARDYFKKPLNIILFREIVNGLMRVKKTSRERRQCLTARQGGLPEMQRRANTLLPSAILKSLVFMSDHLEEPLSLGTVADEAGMSKHHFCRVFKKHMGATPMQSLASIRIERAKSLLRSAHYTISMVAYEAGFSDLSSFIRHFKKVTGITATEFRNLYKSHSE